MAAKAAINVQLTSIPSRTEDLLAGKATPDTLARDETSRPGCDKPGAGRCSGDDLASRRTKLTLEEGYRLTELHNASRANEATGCGGCEEADAQIDRRAGLSSTRPDQHRRSERVVEHGGQEASLDVAARVAELRSADEGRSDPAMLLVGLDQLPPQGVCARWLREGVEHAHSCHSVEALGSTPGLVTCHPPPCETRKAARRSEPITNGGDVGPGLIRRPQAPEALTRSHSGHRGRRSA